MYRIRIIPGEAILNGREGENRLALPEGGFAPDAPCGGNGTCGKCRFPDKAFSSMEGYGLFVTQVCRGNELPYHHSDKTITYTACVLF